MGVVPEHITSESIHLVFSNWDPGDESQPGNRGGVDISRRFLSIII